MPRFVLKNIGSTGTLPLKGAVGVVWVAPSIISDLNLVVWEFTRLYLFFSTKTINQKLRNVEKSCEL